jgi:hypothetical protein
MAHLWETGEGRLSLQVLREYYVTVTAMLDPGLGAAEAREDVLAFGGGSGPERKPAAEAGSPRRLPGRGRE